MLHDILLILKIPHDLNVLQHYNWKRQKVLGVMRDFSIHRVIVHCSGLLPCLDPQGHFPRRIVPYLPSNTIHEYSQQRTRSYGKALCAWLCRRLRSSTWICHMAFPNNVKQPSMGQTQQPQTVAEHRHLVLNTPAQHVSIVANILAARFWYV